MPLIAEFLLISIIFVQKIITVSNPSIDSSSIQPTRKTGIVSLNQPITTAIINKVKLPHFSDPSPDDTSFCSKVDCSNYASCMKCDFPKKCTYGSKVMVNCTTLPKICNGQQQSMQYETICQYCYQVDTTEHECDELRNCSTSSPKLFPTTCRISQHIICMGKRQFLKNVRCQWTNGYSWSRAMILSVTLGGFGIDRFYLGLWKSAIGKLFSFGGLGIWTLIDILLIGVGYIQPADGSSYV
uniref:TM2 domain-containing protein n=1 Tax=Panagrolaimus sp. JU765 TaxID=591449 RepID=A0AC34QB01_9BILA